MPAYRLPPGATVSAQTTAGYGIMDTKEWQGLLKDFYYKRWSTYMKALADQMAACTNIDYDALGSGKNAGKTSAELFQLALPSAPKIDWYALEEPWTCRRIHTLQSQKGTLWM